MDIPKFLKLKDNSLLFNEEGQLLYYIPEDYFTNTKNSVAQISGQYVTTIGIIDWALMSKNGTITEAKPFKLPTVFMCKPSEIEKVKSLKLNGLRPKDYRILHFNYGDEVISDINVPQIIDNVETTFRTMVVNNNKIPSTVPYDKMHEYFTDSMALNGSSFGLNMQLFGILVREMCRDPKDYSRKFVDTDMKDMNAYQQVSIKMLPNYISPYVSITSENFDESLMAAVLLSDKKEEDIAYSPLEKVLMM